MRQTQLRAFQQHHTSLRRRFPAHPFHQRLVMCPCRLPGLCLTPPDHAVSITRSSLHRQTPSTGTLSAALRQTSCQTLLWRQCTASGPARTLACRGLLRPPTEVSLCMHSRQSARQHARNHRLLLRQPRLAKYSRFRRRKVSQQHKHLQYLSWRLRLRHRLRRDFPSLLSSTTLAVRHLPSQLRHGSLVPSIGMPSLSTCLSQTLSVALGHTGCRC